MDSSSGSTAACYIFSQTACLIESRSSLAAGQLLMSPRPYELGRRRDQIDDNRRRVIDAARALLAEATTYTAFTVDAVARRAGVARATVYYQFGSKTGVLEALCDALAEGARLTELSRVFEEPDPRGALKEFIVTFTRFWAADRLVMRRLRALAALDPDVGVVIRARDDRHRQGLAVLTSRLAPGSTAPHADDNGRVVQLLHALTGFEMFDSIAGPEDAPADVASLVTQLVEAALALPPFADTESSPSRTTREH
jgi:AcrR family transcriptional regulator